MANESCMSSNLSSPWSFSFLLLSWCYEPMTGTSFNVVGITITVFPMSICTLLLEVASSDVTDFSIITDLNCCLGGDLARYTCLGNGFPGVLNEVVL
jgi:hypothetical protein